MKKKLILCLIFVISIQNFQISNESSNTFESNKEVFNSNEILSIETNKEVFKPNEILSIEYDSIFPLENTWMYFTNYHYSDPLDIIQNHFYQIEIDNLPYNLTLNTTSLFDLKIKENEIIWIYVIDDDIKLYCEKGIQMIRYTPYIINPIQNFSEFEYIEDFVFNLDINTYNCDSNNKILLSIDGVDRSHPFSNIHYKYDLSVGNHSLTVLFDGDNLLNPFLFHSIFTIRKKPINVNIHNYELIDHNINFNLSFSPEILDISQINLNLGQWVINSITNQSNIYTISFSNPKFEKKSEIITLEHQNFSFIIENPQIDVDNRLKFEFTNISLEKVGEKYEISFEIYREIDYSFNWGDCLLLVKTLGLDYTFTLGNSLNSSGKFKFKIDLSDYSNIKSIFLNFAGDDKFLPFVSNEIEIYLENIGDKETNLFSLVWIIGFFIPIGGIVYFLNKKRNKKPIPISLIRI